jgi:hypothetical protein
LSKQSFRPMAIALSSLLLTSVGAFADTFTFALIPASGSIQGAPGSVIGWGYTITNNSSTYWLDPLAVNAGIFQFATLDTGDYFDFPLVAPDTTVAVSFVAAGGTGFGDGLAALTWNANAPAGFTNSGDFDLSACFSNSLGACLQAAPDELAAYSAKVVAVPEPSAKELLALAFFILLLAGLSIKVRRFLCKPIALAKSVGLSR